MVKRLKNIFILLLSTLYFHFLRMIGKRVLKVYYWREHKNFGDLLTPALLEKYGYNPVYFNPKYAQLISTGSLIEHLPINYSGTILGTGAIDEKSKLTFPYANIIGLRGELTKELLGITPKITLGDPGLLAAKLLKSRSIKKYIIGLIPHYSDANSSLIQIIKSRYPDQITIIDVENSPLTVLTAIDECEYILSSSMHGLICSDSLGIPNRWIQLSTLLGGDFKFRDYYSIFNITPTPLILSGDESIEELIAHTRTVDPIILQKTIADLESQFINILSTINAH